MPLNPQLVLGKLMHYKPTAAMMILQLMLILLLATILRRIFIRAGNNFINPNAFLLPTWVSATQ